MIVALNDRNFPTWKIKMKMALIRDSLWTIVTGDETAPTDTDKLVKFNTRKDKALAQIVLGIEPMYLYLLGDPTDPVSVWAKLQDTFQKKSWSNKFRLKKSLYGMKLGPNDNLQQQQGFFRIQTSDFKPV